MSASVTFAILAGGQGRRLSGADKGLVEVAGRRMIDWVLMNLPAGYPSLIVANRNLDIYKALGLPVISDPWPESLGPLAGMLAALRAVDTEWIQILSCDGLLLPDDLHQQLVLEARRQGAVAAYPVFEARGQFLHVLLHRRIKPQLEDALRLGQRSVGRWLHDIAACAVPIDASQKPLIWSINTPEERCWAEEQMMSLVQRSGLTLFR